MNVSAAGRRLDFILNTVAAPHNLEVKYRYVIDVESLNRKSRAA
ncbi:hypothetical protein [Pseudomonas fluorescens]|nr:hypothetical protein [Pseudomonas fluorescens]